jgi:nucleoside phosphorylase
MGPARQALAIELEPVGIGLPAAAVGATLRLLERRPRMVVLVGTCGAYAEAGLSIGDTVVARSVLLVEPSALEPLGKLCELPVPPMSVVAQAHTGIADALAESGGCRANVATTLGVTVDDRAAGEVARATGAGAEHMEAYGVATACGALGVPFAAALGVANAVGSGAREQWRAHHREASAAASRVVLHWLRRGAPGLSSEAEPSGRADSPVDPRTPER